MIEVEIYLIVDESGNSSVGDSLENAQEAYDNYHNEGGAKRVVKLTINVPEPEPVPVTVDVPEEKTGPVNVQVL